MLGACRPCGLLVERVPLRGPAGRISASLDQGEVLLRSFRLALGAPMIRTFGLNSPEFYEVMCRPEERPWIPNGALRREPKWPKRDDRVWVSAADDESAEGAFREWAGHVEAGRIVP